ncbi:MAG: zinc-binding dehydrogenase [Chloroflexota bacterium]|nr:zinc-binding dehydrogenase [Chloroflexota bacterium]
MRTKAVVFTGVGEVEVGEVNVPHPGDGEVLVRTTLTGISVGTDGWMIRGLYAGVRDRYPMIYGYQRVGVVEEVGPGADSLEVGDRVFVGLNPTRLEDGDPLGPTARNYTGMGCHDHTMVTKIPDAVGDVEASMGGVTSTPMVGRNLTKPEDGDLVLVIGQGMIGQMAAQLYRAAGARVMTVDILEGRVELSRKVSADIALNAGSEDVVQAVHAEQAAGADIVVECTGRSESLPMMLEAVRGACNDPEKPGRICLQGYFVNPIEINFDDAHHRRLTMTFPCGFDVAGTREVFELLAERKLNVKDLITHDWHVDQAPEAFQLMLGRPGEVLGMYMRWGD